MRIVLAGAGHAHIVALRHFAKTRPRAEIILINDGRFAWYTGALPALIRRDISEDAARLDVANLAARCGARFIDARVTGHCEQRDGIKVSLHNQDSVACDRLSLSTGGEKRDGGVKPIPEFLCRLKRLDGIARPKIAIIGAGAAGLEIALALRIRLPAARLYLRPSETGILPAAPRRARKIARAALQAANVIICGTLTEPLDDTIHAYTPEPNLAIRPTLQLTKSERVWAAGDCARFPDPLPRSGAIAVRQGRILAHNLISPGCKIFRPPLATLAIMSLNSTHALAWYGVFSVRGRLPMFVKSWLDREWLSE